MIRTVTAEGPDPPNELPAKGFTLTLQAVAASTGEEVRIRMLSFEDRHATSEDALVGWTGGREFARRVGRLHYPGEEDDLVVGQADWTKGATGHPPDQLVPGRPVSPAGSSPVAKSLPSRDPSLTCAEVTAPSAIFVVLTAPFLICLAVTAFLPMSPYSDLAGRVDRAAAQGEEQRQGRHDVGVGQAIERSADDAHACSRVIWSGAHATDDSAGARFLPGWALEPSSTRDSSATGARDDRGPRARRQAIARSRSASWRVAGWISSGRYVCMSPSGWGAFSPGLRRSPFLPSGRHGAVAHPCGEIEQLVPLDVGARDHAGVSTSEPAHD